ncbi:hypothetical protein DRQ32_00830 [bacterium]|nr:MAG: hypothetical protein DRQ32_00830 [bacterium]
MNRKLWVDKRFNFEFPSSEYESLIETLSAAPQRLTALLGGLSHEVLIRKPEGSWSLQENAGHLMSLEALFVGRLDDYEAGATGLRAADMSNQATDTAQHNGSNISDILEGFATVRGDYIQRLRGHPAAWFATVAHHPRLDQPMRVVDQLKFQAAHDAHHFQRIEDLLAGSQPSG